MFNIKKDKMADKDLQISLLNSDVEWLKARVESLNMKISVLNSTISRLEKHFNIKMEYREPTYTYVKIEE